MPRKPDLISTMLRDAQAIELRKAGVGYAQIAERLGFAHKSGAHHAVQRALKESLERRDVDADSVRELELQRLDDMLLGLWQSARKGNVQAVTAVLRLMERRSMYLGLDAPKKQEITGADGGAIQIEQTVDVNVSIEERQRRILAIVEQARGRLDPLALPGRSDMATTGGSTDDGLADAG